MKKILGYIAVLVVFSWMTTANATPIASIENSNGNLTISGFNTGANPFVNFQFDFTPGQSGVVRVNEPVVIGGNYHVHVGFDITLLSEGGPSVPTSPFTADFDLVSLFAFNPADFTPPKTVNQILTGLIAGGATSFTPTNAFLTVKGDTYQLNTVNVLGVNSLLLGTQSIIGNKLITFLNCLDGGGIPTASPGCTADTSTPDGIVRSGFSNANVTVVPEPTALLLLGSGLLVMFGFSKKGA
jgi:hypothetical protein